MPTSDRSGRGRLGVGRRDLEIGLGSGRGSPRRPGRCRPGLLLAGRPGRPALGPILVGRRRRSHRGGRRLHRAVDGAAGQDGPTPTSTWCSSRPTAAAGRHRDGTAASAPPASPTGWATASSASRTRSTPWSASAAENLDDIEAAVGSDGRSTADSSAPASSSVATEPHQVEALLEAAEPRPGGTGTSSPSSSTGTRCRPRSTPPPSWPGSGTATGAPWSTRPGWPGGCGGPASRCRGAHLRAQPGGPARTGAVGPERRAPHRARDGRVRTAVALGTNAFPSLVRRLRTLRRPRLRLRADDRTAAPGPASCHRLASAARGSAARATSSSTTGCSADDRILFGGYDAVYHFGNGMGPSREQRPATFMKLARAVRRDLPPARGRPFHPLLGRGHRHLLTLLRLLRPIPRRSGGVGRGLHRARGGSVPLRGPGDAGPPLREETELTRLRFVRDKPIPFPPEPIRFAGIGLTRWSMARADGHGGRATSGSGRWTGWAWDSTPDRIRHRGGASAGPVRPVPWATDAIGASGEGGCITHPGRTGDQGRWGCGAGRRPGLPRNRFGRRGGPSAAQVGFSRWRAGPDRVDRRRPGPPTSSRRRAPRVITSPVSATWRLWVTTRQKSRADPSTVDTGSPSSEAPMVQVHDSPAATSGPRRCARAARPDPAPDRRRVGTAPPGGPRDGAARSAPDEPPGRRPRRVPWAQVSIKRAEMNDSTPMGGPNQGTRAVGSAPANAAIMPVWALVPPGQEGVATHGTTPHQVGLHGIPVEGHGLLGHQGELVGLHHGQPTGIVEVGQVADLVPHRPSLGRGGTVPLRARRGQRAHQAAGSRRTRRRGRRGVPAGWPWVQVRTHP